MMPRRSSVEKRAKLIAPAFTVPTQVPKVFSLPTVPAMISWKSIFTSLKKCFGRLEQWKQTPCRDRRRSCCSSRAAPTAFPRPARACTCSARPAHPLRRRSESGCSLIMLMTVQGTTPKNSSIDVQHCTALIVTCVCFIQPSMTAPSFAIFISASSGTPDGGDILLDGGQLGLRRIVVVLHAIDAAEDLGEIERSRPRCRSTSRMLSL